MSWRQPTIITHHPSKLFVFCSEKKNIIKQSLLVVLFGSRESSYIMNSNLCRMRKVITIYNSSLLLLCRNRFAGLKTVGRSVLLYIRVYTLDCLIALMEGNFGWNFPFSSCFLFENVKTISLSCKYVGGGTLHD